MARRRAGSARGPVAPEFGLGLVGGRGRFWSVSVRGALAKHERRNVRQRGEWPLPGRELEPVSKNKPKRANEANMWL